VQRARILISLMITALLTACAAASSVHVVSDGERYAAPTSQVENYKLGAGDTLRVIVFNEPTLSGDFIVNAGGTLSLPLIGDVPAQGLGTDSIEKTVQAKLADGYVRDPKVSIQILTYRPFFILGEVKQPGQYPYAANMTATNAIALAQGYTPRGVRTVVYIRRAGETTETAYKVTPYLRIWPGDTLRIPERFF